MWRILKKELQPGRVEHYQIVTTDDLVMSYAQVMECWANDPVFDEFFSDQLASSAFEAFLWETPPLTRATLHRSFECVLIDSPPLARAAPDTTSFAEHFRTGSGQAMVCFDNLGGDARLVAPCPLEPLTACVHLAAFLREAPAEARIHLWQEVSSAVTGALNEQPLWISTCGLGVYWLHVRLDSFPKYYRHTPYQYPG